MTITKEEEEIEGNEHVQDEKMEDAQEVKGEEETINVQAKDIKKDEIVETNASVEEEVKAAEAIETNDWKMMKLWKQMPVWRKKSRQQKL